MGFANAVVVMVCVKVTAVKKVIKNETDGFSFANRLGFNEAVKCKTYFLYNIVQ